MIKEFAIRLILVLAAGTWLLSSLLDTDKMARESTQELMRLYRDRAYDYQMFEIEHFDSNIGVIELHVWYTDEVQFDKAWALSEDLEYTIPYDNPDEFVYWIHKRVYYSDQDSFFVSLPRLDMKFDNNTKFKGL